MNLTHTIRSSEAAADSSARGAQAHVYIPVLIASWCLAFTANSWAGAGDLDPSFGDGGKVTLDLVDVAYDGISGKYNATVQPDGKILLVGGGRGYAGLSQSENIIRRFNPDGSPDAAFGEAGVVHIQFFSGSSARGVTLQSDGKIIVGLITSTIEGYVDVALVRLNQDGSLDTTYGTDGQIVVDLDSGSADYLRALAIREDNEVIIGADCVDAVTEDGRIVLLAVTPDGKIDHTFGVAGRVEFDSAETSAIDSLEYADGHLLVSGNVSSPSSYYGTGMVARLSKTGAFDPSFAVRGILVEENVYRIVAIDTLADGRILALSSFNQILRYLPDGAPDPDFGLQPRLAIDVAKLYSLGFNAVRLNDIESLDDGRAILGGSFIWYNDDFYYYYDHSRIGAVRLLSDGSIDTSYGDRGVATAAFEIDPLTDEVTYSEARSLIIQADGKALLAGMVESVLEKSRFLELNMAMARFSGDGDVDNTFGVNGTVATNNGGGTTDDYADEVTTIQGDGKIVTASASFGIHDWDIAVTRHNPDGSLDTSFNGKGWVKTDIRSARILLEQCGWSGCYPYVATTSSSDYPVAVAIQSDGKIVVGGNSEATNRATRKIESFFVLVRYNTDGSLDPTFGNGGIVVQEALGDSVSSFGVANFMGDMALQADGKIVVTGNVWFDQSPPAPGYEFLTARYDSSGVLDPTFGNGGIVVTNGSPQKKNDYPSGIAIQPDGKIVVSGTFLGYLGRPFSNGVVIRYNPDGTLDTSFDGDGRLAIIPDPLGNGSGPFREISFMDIAVAPDGAIIVGGEASGYKTGTVFALMRIEDDGQIDSSFGNDGYATADPHDRYSAEYLSGISVTSDGRILAAGQSATLRRLVGADSTLGRPPASKYLTSYDMVVSRFLPDGSRDFAFGDAGIVRTDFDGTGDGAYGVTVQPDGKILAAGYTWTTTTNYYIEGHWDIALARYEGVSTNVDELEGLVAQIQMSASMGVLNEGQTRSLVGIVQAALLQVDMGNLDAAMSQLDAFEKLLDKYVSVRSLPQDTAMSWKNTVAVVRGSL